MSVSVSAKDRTAWLQSMIDSFPHPNCFSLMKPRLVQYIEDTSLTFAYPVLEMYLNPAKSMQGGFISAAFDNTFGFLCSLITDLAKITSLNLDITYHWPIYLNDELIITVLPKSVGGTIVHLIGEAVNRENKLIATGSSTLMILKNN